MEHGLCINTQISSITSLVSGHVTTVTRAVLIMQRGGKPYFTYTHYQQQVADAHFADTITDFAQLQHLRCHRQNSIEEQNPTLPNSHNHKRNRLNHLGLYLIKLFAFNFDRLQFLHRI